MKLLKSTASRNRWPANASHWFAWTWPKLRLHLCWDVLPTLLMVAVLGCLTLKAAEYLNRHRTDGQIAMVAQK